MNVVFLRVLAVCFGWLVNVLPEVYRPAGRAFLRSLVTKPEAVYPVPKEILPTIALAVLNSIFEGQLPPGLSYEAAVGELNKHQKPVLVQSIHYPCYRGRKLEGYPFNPHYYVMGGFTSYPLGDGLWLVEDRYDWHQPDSWRVPDAIARRVPKWLLKKFAYSVYGVWVLDEVDTLKRLTVSYWHRSIVKLADYLNPQDFE